MCFTQRDDRRVIEQNGSCGLNLAKLLACTLKASMLSNQETPTTISPPFKPLFIADFAFIREGCFGIQERLIVDSWMFPHAIMIP